MERQPEAEAKGGSVDISPIHVTQKVGRPPSAGTAISGTSSGNVSGVVIENLIIRDSINRIGEANPANVQQIAASQLELLAQLIHAESRKHTNAVP
jgi:hypothetical protein